MAKYCCNYKTVIQKTENLSVLNHYALILSIYMPFKNTDKSECLTVYSGISLSLQIPKSRNKVQGFFRV